jgi:hypothetical protein
MKYYLVIGYCLTEKHKEYPTVTVHINGSMVEQFIADNEATKEISTTLNVQNKITGLGTYSHSQIRDWTFNFKTTVKYKIMEVDTSDWPSEGEITIDVSNNNSDYNNGFMSKRSIITLQPIILINKELLHNKNAMQRIFKKLTLLEEFKPTPNPTVLSKASARKVEKTVSDNAENSILTRLDNRSRTRWPGITEYRINGKLPVTLTRGGNFQLRLKILRKHKTFFVTTDQWRPSGFFFTEHFFSAWYQHFSKDFFKITISQHYDETDGGANGTATKKATLKKINNSNEDQRSNNTKD